MKIIFEKSTIDILEVKAKNQFSMENRESEIKNINVECKTLELKGEFFTNIEINKVKNIMLESDFRLLEKSLKLNEDNIDIKIIYNPGSDVNIDILNKAKIEILRGESKKKLYINSNDDVEVYGIRNLDDSFIGIRLNGEGKVKVDRSVYEIDFKESKNITLEFYNLESLPNLKGILENKILKVIGSDENIKEILGKGISIEEIELEYNVEFKNGVGMIEINNNFLEIDNLKVKIKENKDYELKRKL
ncbi:MAG: hypothetical protein ACRDDY_08125 [Clostridium sp.]|uniref:hypothetical protein n=1 Tax=Clostridium sp. TaxID=1506 RepID=UPI003EE59A45